MNRRQDNSIKDGMQEEILQIRRLSKKTKGGNYISFSVLSAVGDKNGKIGIGLGRGLEVPQAIRKSLHYARKNVIEVPIINETLPHDIRVKYKASSIVLYPAQQGVGLKVGSVVRTILMLAGIKNASGKILGTRNKITNTYAVMHALKRLKPRT